MTESHLMHDDALIILWYICNFIKQSDASSPLGRCTWEGQADKVIIFGCFNERQQAQLLPRVEVCNTGRVIKNIEIAKPPSTSSSHSRAQVQANMLAVTLPVSGPRLIFFIFSSNRVSDFSTIFYIKWSFELQCWVIYKQI